MRIAFDIDQVLADIIQGARSVLAADLGISPESIVDTFEYSQPFTHGNPDLAARLVVEHSFWDREDLLTTCPVVPGAAEAVRRVHDAGHLAGYITRRPGHVSHLTTGWLAANGFMQAPVHHVGTGDAATNFDRCKSAACKMIGATHLIDDHATEVTTAGAAGICVVVVDTPVGRRERHEALLLRPQTLVARDAAHAVQLLLTPMTGVA
jgi:hypothetical protein